MKRHDHQLTLLKLLLTKENGEIVFDKPLFPRTYRIGKIRGVPTQLELTGEHSTEEWNNYVEQLRKLIGVKTYMEWIYECDDEGCELAGLIACFDPEGREIKLKWFTEWLRLLRKCS